MLDLIEFQPILTLGQAGLKLSIVSQIIMKVKKHLTKRLSIPNLVYFEHA
jgi:hypothetical protein